MRNPREKGASKPKLNPTRSRITKEQKAEQKKKGRAIYVALGKNVKDRAPTHDKLSKHLAELKLEGAQRIKTSGTSYYALVFDMVGNRNRAMAKIGNSTFVTNEG